MISGCMFVRRINGTFPVCFGLDHAAKSHN
jgi:hypothetical protein